MGVHYSKSAIFRGCSPFIVIVNISCIQIYLLQNNDILYASLVLFLKIRVYLLYNVVLVPAIQRSESAACIHISLAPPPPKGHRRALS